MKQVKSMPKNDKINRFVRVAVISTIISMSPFVILSEGMPYKSKISAEVARKPDLPPSDVQKNAVSQKSSTDAGDIPNNEDPAKTETALKGAPQNEVPQKSQPMRIRLKQSEIPDVDPKEPALTLSDCYELALKQSETIAIDAEVIKETEAHFLEAMGTLLPHVSFLSTDNQEEKKTSGGGGSGLQSLTPSKSSQRQFVFTQKLFSGFKEFAAIAGSRSERGQRENEKKRAEQLLLVDVAGAFYLVMEERDDIRTLQRIKGILMSRIKDLRQREALGRSRTSEVVNAKAQLFAVEAEIELVKSQESVARDLLEFLVGKPVGELSNSSDHFPALNGEDYYVSKAEHRFDVNATRCAWELAEKNIIVATSGFLPSVSAQANYYTQRTGFDKDVNWDAALTVNVPVFEGTETLGQVKEAMAQARVSELTYMRTKRLATQEIRDSFTQFKNSVSQYRALKKALNAAEANYYLQKQDYQYSLVNNLDVLQAIQTMQDTRRNYIHTLYQTKRLYWRLLASVDEATLEKTRDAF